MKRCLSCKTVFVQTSWRCPTCSKIPQEHLGFLAFAPDSANASEGFEAEFFSRLAQMEPGHFWFESRNRLILWALQHFSAQAEFFLEIGCGTAFVLTSIHKRFPKITLSGSEIFSAGLLFAHQRLPDVSLYQMDACAIPFDNEFDVIGAFDVLEHIPDDQLALQQIFQAVKPGGKIILTVPQHPWLWSSADTYGHHQRRYTRTELKEKVCAAGFDLVYMTSFISLLLPLMFVSRILQPKEVKDFDPASEFKVNPVINKLLELTLSVEMTFIKMGISLPAGGSLMAIASKNQGGTSTQE